MVTALMVNYRTFDTAVIQRREGEEVMPNTLPDCYKCNWERGTELRTGKIEVEFSENRVALAEYVSSQNSLWLKMVWPNCGEISWTGPQSYCGALLWGSRYSERKDLEHAAETVAEIVGDKFDKVERMSVETAGGNIVIEMMPDRNRVFVRRVEKPWEVFESGKLYLGLPLKASPEKLRELAKKTILVSLYRRVTLNNHH